jgi:hypothetical protein
MSADSITGCPSVAMIEKHYGHLRADAPTAALAQLAL